MQQVRLLPEQGRFPLLPVSLHVAYDEDTTMRYFYFLFAVFATVATNQVGANDLNLSIRIGQPGFYGELYLGGYYPTPQLIYPQPILIWRTPANMHQPPVYLHVPPGHAKHWHKHCHLYHACNRNVYFVRESWYNQVYMPYYQKHISSRNKRHDNRYRQPQQYVPGKQDERTARDQPHLQNHPGRSDSSKYRSPGNQGKRDSNPGKGKQDNRGRRGD